MCYFALLLGFGLHINYAKAQHAGEIVLYSETNFQGVSQAYPFVAASCVGNENGFPSALNESVRSLKTDHTIAVHPVQYCMTRVRVTLGAGSYPDLPSFLRNQDPDFRTVIKSFFMLPFQQDNIQLFTRQGPQGQTPTPLWTLLVADIDHATPCFKFNDTMSTNIGGVDNHLNCLMFYTGKNCQGRIFKVDAQEKQVNFEEYQPSDTYYGMRLCGNDNGAGKDIGRLKTAHVTVKVARNDPYLKDQQDNASSEK